MKIVAVFYAVPAIGLLLGACAAEDTDGRVAVPAGAATPGFAGSPAVAGAEPGLPVRPNAAGATAMAPGGLTGGSAATANRPNDLGTPNEASMGSAGRAGSSAMPASDGREAELGGAGVGGAASPVIPATAGSPAPVPAEPSTFPAVEDFDRDGPFTPMSEAAGLTCTIFRPRTLGEEGRRHPVLVWGNGTFNTPSSYTSFLMHLASHGFIVTAANTSNAGSGREMLDCLDDIVARDKAEGPYRGAVDFMRVLATGYSQGGAGSMMAARDPRFLATGLISPFTVLPLGGFAISSVDEQIHPMLMISGSVDAVASPDAHQRPIFMQAKVPIVWATLSGASHLEVLGTGGRYRGVMTAWYRARLMDDPQAAELFSKDTCTLCERAGWRVEWNGLWKD